MNSVSSGKQSIRRETHDLADEVPLPAQGASSDALFNFKQDLFIKCKERCPKTIAQVDWTLVEKYKDDIYKIWSAQCLKEDCGRLIKLCFTIVPSEKIGDTIILTIREYNTILFIMACIRVQSTHGRPMKRATQHQIELSKEKKNRRKTRLIAQDIEERMEHELLVNIGKYCNVDKVTANGEDYVEISDKQGQPYRPLFEDPNEFLAFIEKKTPENKRQVQKRPRDLTDIDAAGTPESEKDSEQVARKSLRATIDTSTRQGMLLAPPAPSQSRSIAPPTLPQSQLATPPQATQAIPEPGEDEFEFPALELLTDDELQYFTSHMQELNDSVEDGGAGYQPNTGQLYDLALLPIEPDFPDYGAVDDGVQVPTYVNTEAPLHQQSVGAQ